MSTRENLLFVPHFDIKISVPERELSLRKKQNWSMGYLHIIKIHF